MVSRHFALFSANATKVELCLFDDRGGREFERIQLPEYTDEVWHGCLPTTRPGTAYAGPFEPASGIASIQNKLVIDPYAKQLVGQLKWGRNYSPTDHHPEGQVLRSQQRTTHAEMPRDPSGIHVRTPIHLSDCFIIHFLRFPEKSQ